MFHPYSLARLLSCPRKCPKMRVHPLYEAHSFLLVDQTVMSENANNKAPECNDEPPQFPSIGRPARNRNVHDDATVAASFNTWPKSRASPFARSRALCDQPDPRWFAGDPADGSPFRDEEIFVAHRSSASADSPQRWSRVDSLNVLKTTG